MFRVIMTSCSLPFGPCALARKGGPGSLASLAGDVGGPSAPQGSRGVWGAARPPTPKLKSWRGGAQNLNLDLDLSLDLNLNLNPN